jgi:hypothetical protein
VTEVHQEIAGDLCCPGARARVGWDLNEMDLNVTSLKPGTGESPGPRWMRSPRSWMLAMLVEKRKSACSPRTRLRMGSSFIRSISMCCYRRGDAEDDSHAW